MKKIVGCRISVKTKKGGNAGSASLLPDPVRIPSNKQSKGSKQMRFVQHTTVAFLSMYISYFFCSPLQGKQAFVKDVQGNIFVVSKVKS